MRWAVGVTTCKRRLDDTLPRTLASLRTAGFERPYLFIDGVKEWPSSLAEYEGTLHFPPVLTFANAMMGLAELLARHPISPYFVLGQDDFVCSRNLRQYLERTIPERPRSYFNCYTFPSNEEMCSHGHRGWFEARTLSGGALFDSGIREQTGRGAVLLVFPREAVLDLLSQPDLIRKPLNAGRYAWKKLDGAICNAMNKCGYKEMCHSPCLIQHFGHVSSMGNRRHHDAPSFRGESFDCLTLLASQSQTG